MFRQGCPLEKKGPTSGVGGHVSAVFAMQASLVLVDPVLNVS